MTQFEYFWKRGYRALLPVVPGDDIMRNAGKRPGEWSPSGYWYGTGVQTYVATEELIDKWASWPKPGVGLRTHKDYVPIDIDSLASAFVDRAKEIAGEVFGEIGAERIGNAPKSLLLYQTYDTVPYQNYRFDDGTENGGLIEMQGGVSNKFIVVQGKHPKGMKYHWTAGDVPERAALPYATAAQVDEFFRRIKAEFPKVKGSSISAAIDREKVDQAGLKCPPEKIDALVAGLKLLPNTRATFGGYDKWVVAAAACRGAFQDDEHLGCDVFCEISERTDIADLTEDPEHIYWSLDPPFAFGYPYLRSLITQSNETGAAAGELWCEPIADEPTPASDVAGLFDTPPAADDKPAKLLPFTSLLDAAASALDHSNKPLVKGLLDQGTLSVMYGPSNVGKTFVAMDVAFHVAAGTAWANMKVSPGAIVYVAAEGGAGARKRAAALRRKFPEESAHADFQLLLSSIDLLRADADLAPLIASIKALGRPVVLVVLDTLARVMAGGDENGSIDMGTLVKHFDKIRAATGAHVMVVHHSGKDVARGARGHSLLRAATDTEIEIAEGQIAVTKQRDLDKAYATAFRLDVVQLGVDADGDPVTSCTVELVRRIEEPLSPLTPKEQIVIDTLNVLLSATDAKGVRVSEIVEYLGEQKQGDMSSETVRAHLKNMAKKRSVRCTSRGFWATYTDAIPESLQSSASFFAPIEIQNPEESGRPNGNSVFE